MPGNPGLKITLVKSCTVPPHFAGKEKAHNTHCKIVQTMNSTETVKKSLECDYFKVKVLTNAEWGRVVPAPHGSWHT